MTKTSATAIAHPNIAFIKYWGNRDEQLRIPANGSISMNLAGLETRTTVSFSPEIKEDRLSLNGEQASGAALARASQFLERVREMAGVNQYAEIESANNFPTGAGIASSASAYAALAVAASTAAGLELGEKELSQLARTGSGSACRSIPEGFVEWVPGKDDESSFASSIAGREHWSLVDCICILSAEHKPVGSTQGHALAASSPLQAARVADAPRRLDVCRKALLDRDFEAFAEIVESDCNLMHAVMMTSSPMLIYWQPATLAVMRAVQEWRAEGLSVCYTIDAGPNVHVLCLTNDEEEVTRRLGNISGIQRVIAAKAGGPAKLIQPPGEDS
jgi:diphosphomevalonate decarboxylase